MQNGGFVNKIQGVRLSVAKIHRHVFENPGFKEGRLMAQEKENQVRNGIANGWSLEYGYTEIGAIYILH